ncbi:MATE family efflux transporter [Ferrimonas balearica]|uniref:MATE family efflux transporter n=1 Tax=Ferrimonas balearica TaxID=44012 RepID=UPI001C5A341D|nr:MATE family efflux transporter [Ferrimonas balearica]MBW3164818.1 MATE family efflux transporter [Ferrimonas balearica]MBY6107098.1 MATE family efflux transporter [Ferrimonas balearica]
MSADLSRQDVNRQFWRYVLPTVAAMLVSGLYQLVDGIFIGRYIGADGLAAINVAWPIAGVLYGLGMMVGVGAGALSSLSRGEGKLARARAQLGNGLVLMALMALAATGLLWVLGEPGLAIQNAEGNVLALAQDYLHVLMLAAPVALGSMAMPFMLRNDGAPNRATALIVAGAVTNIVLDWLFIAEFGWGLTGAAAATALAQLLVTLMGIAHFFSDKAQTRLTLADLKLRPYDAWRSCAIGLSSLLMYGYYSVVVALHNGLFLHYGDATVVGAYAIVSYLMAVYFLFAEGVASGTQPLISYHYGAGEYGLMKRYIRLMLKVAVGSGVVALVLLNLASAPVISIFNSADANLFAATEHGLRLHLIALYLDGFIFCVGVIFQSFGASGKATGVTLANMGIQLPFLLVLPQWFGLDGVWLALPISNVALSLVAGALLWREWRQLEARLG